MGRKQHNPVGTRIALLERRLGFVESQASPETRGWAARFGRAHVIAACLAAALAAAGSLIGLWRQLVVAPDVRLAFLGDNIEVRWDTEAGLLSFDCWLVAENAGRANDVLQARARLKTATGHTVVFRQIALREQGSGDSLPFLRATAGNTVQVRVTLTMPALDGARQRTLREEELHTLVLDFEGPLSHLTKTMTNCFWFGKGVAGELASNGSAPITWDDRCTGS
jgi:hypothetical protein